LEEVPVVFISGFLSEPVVFFSEALDNFFKLVGSCIVRISDMRQTHLRHVDLNLLLALHALLEERHVTRASKRCFLSQSAMSRALERLREMFGDALLIRSGRGYERTVRGDHLLRELQSLLPRLESLVRGEEFDPRRSQDRFRLAVRHHASITIVPPLIRRIRAEAPGARLEVSEWEERAYEAVMAGSLDAALSAEHPPSDLESEKSSADKVMRTPLSKQRNKHIQRVLVEAAKLAPREDHKCGSPRHRAMMRLSPCLHFRPVAD
jgi:DNA-binding transcriptional LysR family regulator